MKNSPEREQADNGFDAPLENPTGDLLDMNQHAQALADFIRQHEALKSSFTIGIFGEWGEGKTTLVHFMKGHLEQGASRVKFVEFSAWPYTTSEKLWRALILKIAKDVLTKEGESPTTPADQTVPKNEPENGSLDGIFGRTVGFLTYDFFARKEPPKLTRYEEFVRELDSTEYGSISKRTPTAGLTQESMMSAVIQGTISALSTVSPLVSGLRGLFGFDTKADGFSSEQATDVSSKAIDALQNFQKSFDDLLKEAGEVPVYVFIDDLDRAQPDVALDIMESIRIALNRSRCIFIIAVDERLIAQGLRLRYKELFADSKGDFATKGREYLEKIIQFRTRVPPRTAEQTQRLIAAQYPHWTPAGDIIQSIAGTNPRRIKQYCQRLSFQRLVGSNFRLGSISQDGFSPSSTRAKAAEDKK